ncbi:MAG: MoaD/ThiS family protein [Myxococcota bacterium]
MARVSFTQNVQRHVSCPPVHVEGSSLREVMEEAFLAYPEVRSYVVDEQGALRRHMIIFIDGRQLEDRVGLSDPVGPLADVHVMQALSGG